MPVRLCMLCFSTSAAPRLRTPGSAVLRRPRAGWLTGAVVLGAVTACTGTTVIGREKPSSCDLGEYLGDADLTTVRIATFWESDPDEARAIAVLRDRLRHVPSTRGADGDGYALSSLVRNDRAEEQGSLNDWLPNRRNLLDAFQVNGGSDVLHFVLTDRQGGSLVCPLNRLEERYSWKERYFPRALEPASCNGSLYALPLGIHRLNVLFYNRERLEIVRARARELDEDVPQPSELENAEQLLSLLEEIPTWEIAGTGGDPLVPLAIGTEASWPITIVAFENLLASYHEQIYETLWMGRGDDDNEPKLRDAFRRLAGDLRRIDKVSTLGERISWQTAIDWVVQGKALFVITGDWAWAQIPEHDRAEVGMIPFPGTEDTYVYTPDSFAVPQGDDTNGAAAHLWLREVLDDQETILEFAHAKQCIPAVAGLNDDELDSLGSDYLSASYRKFAECQDDRSGCRLLLAVSGLAPPPEADPCYDDMGYLLSHIAGSPIWGETRACPTHDIPASEEEAEEEMIEILLRLSREGFAAECR